MLMCLIFPLCLSSQLVKARGNVENWLGLVEESMMVSLKKLTKAAIVDFETKPRHEWATQHPSQVCLRTLTLERSWERPNALACVL